MAGPNSPFLTATATKSSVNLGPISNLRELNFWQRDAIRQPVGITPTEAFACVPWLYRSVTLRADSLADVPWSIYQGKTEILTSEDDETDPPIGLEWIRPAKAARNVDPTRPTLGDLLRITEIDLCLSGAAYWLPDKGVRTGRRVSFRRALPSTIRLDTDPNVGLKGFIRTIGDKEIPFKIGDMPFWWLPNPEAELGPGPSPAYVALTAAGLMRNINDFANGFFERGAINTTILSVEGNPPDGELRRLETWWKRLLRGNRNAHETVALKAAIKPVVVGQAPKHLAMTDLSLEKRHDIAAAMGVPMALLNDTSANFATAQQSAFNFWNLTVLPECERIEIGLNRQVFAPLGYELRFKPELLDAIQRQRDEKAYEMLAAVEGGVVTPNEMRAQLGLEDNPKGTDLREAPVPQVTANQRVGGLNSRAPSGTQPA